jgi:hypothetical protein
MNKLKKLQKDYQAGKLTEEQYKAKLQELLDGEDIDQDQHDEALEFDPEEGGGEKLIYSQADMDAAIIKKARALVRKELRDAGVDVSEIKPQELLAKVAEMAAAGSGKEKETDKELLGLRKKAAAYDALEPANKALTIENAVLKAAGKLNPVNPAQVVRALNADYADLLDFDEETGQLDPKSVSKAIKKIAEVEPNLFKTATNDEDQDEDDELEGGEGGQGGTFSGKAPGGAGGGTTKQTKEAAKLAAGKAAALEMLGIKQEK